MQATWRRWGLSTISLAQWLRTSITLLCVGVSAADGSAMLVVPGAAALLLLDLLPRPRSQGRAWLLLGLAVSTGTVVVALDRTTAALPFLIITAFQAGERCGTRCVVAERAVAGAALLAWMTSGLAHTAMPGNRLLEVWQWWLLGAALGLLTAFSQHVQPTVVDVQHAAAREAARLSGRLQRVARELPLGLDASAVAQNLMDEVFGLVDADISAVLLKVDSQTASPLALRGATRLPWRDPARSRGALHDAWVAERVTVDVRPPDPDGRRAGSAMLCLPVRLDGRPMTALLVVERRRPEPFSDAEVRAADQATHWVAPQLTAALHFGELERLGHGVRARAARA